MDVGRDILDALSQPLRALADPGERIFWLFVASAIVLPWLVMGIRRGTTALREGLFRPAAWTSSSSRADVTLLFIKALLFGLWRIPWLAATTGATLWVGLSLHRWLGPPPELQWSRLAIAILYTAVLFVGWDLSRFALHRLMHRVRWLWSFHQVHHSARVLTPLTLYRTHPVETLLYDARGLVVTASITGLFAYLFAGTARPIELLGIGVFGFSFNLLGANLRHSHVWLGFGPLERWLISPAQHQLHHGRRMDQQHANFGTWLALWDRIFGSWVASPPEAPEDYGLEDANHSFDRVMSMLLGPLVDSVRGRNAAAGAAALLAALFVARPASAEPAGQEPTEPSDGGDAETSEPEATPEPAPETTEPETPETEAAETPAAEGEPPEQDEPEAATTEDAPADAPEALPAETAEPEPAPTEPAPTEVIPAEEVPLEDPADAVAEEEDDDVRMVKVGSMFPADEIPRVAGSAHIVGEKELERHEYDDVHRVLNTVPGVYVRGEDGFGLRPNIGLRGANPDRSAKVNLLEDGILLGPAPYSAPAAYYFPLTTRLVGMEVYKGPGSIQYGPNTIGGSINLRTREIPDEHTGGVDLAGGRFGYAKGHAFYGTRYKGFGILLEAARIQTNGFKELDTGGNTGFIKNDAMLKLGYRTPGEGRRITHEVEAKLGIGNEDSNETYLGLTRADFETTPYRRYAASDEDNMGWWRSQAELTYLLRQRETLEIEARLYRHDFDRVWRRLDRFSGGPALTDILAQPDGGQAAVFAAILRGEQDSQLPQHTLLVTNNDRRFVSQGVQSAFRWKPKWEKVAQELEVGARVHHDQIRRNHSSDSFNMISGSMVSDGGPRTPTVVNQGSSIAAAFHLHDALTFWDRFTVAPGLRMEIVSSRFVDELADAQDRRMDTALTPGIGTLFQATPWLQAFAGVHRGFSPVAPGQPEEVEPEFSINYEAGLRSIWRGLWVEAVGFASDYNNLIGACTFSAGCVEGDGSDQFNAGAVLVYGLESLARFRHRFDNGFGLELGARYTYTGSRFRGAFSSAFPQWGEIEEGDELPYLPKHLVGGTVGIGGSRWDVVVSPNYTGPMRDMAGQGDIPDAERVDGFFVLAASVEVRVLDRFRIYGQGANLTNNAYIASYRPFGIRPGAPLTFSFGVKVDLFP